MGKKKRLKQARAKKKAKSVKKNYRRIYLIAAVGVIAIAVVFVLSSRKKNIIEPVTMQDQFLRRSAHTDFRKDGELTFLTKSGDTLSTIDIEIPENSTMRTVGLMFRDEMKEHQGMLFIFPDTRLRSFWMKNTILPLDIMFADSTRRIVKIHKNTIPLSTGHYYSGQPAKYVVEVNAGYCDKNKIGRGVIIDWKTF